MKAYREPPTGAASSAEDELLLLLACARPTPEVEGRIRSLVAQETDWDALLAAARWHGILPLLTRNLLAACADALPTPILDQLLLSREYVARRNRIMALELVRLLGLFKRHGIAAVGLKGPLLAAHVYGNLALREFGDLDILVQRGARARAHRLLLAQGYRVAAYHQGGDELFVSRLGQAHYHLAYEHPATAMHVELHWRINPRFISASLDTPDFWRRLEPRRLLSTTVRDLAPEDQLLQLAIHGSKHIWDRLKYVCDIAACVERYPALNWARLVARARRLHNERPLFLALDLAHRLLGTPLADPIARAIDADPTIAMLGAQLTERLLARVDFGDRFWAVEMIPYWLRFRSRRRDRVFVYPYLIFYVWLKVKPTENDRAFVRLPGRLEPLYYLARPVRVAILAARGARRRVRAAVRPAPADPPDAVPPHEAGASTRATGAAGVTT